MNYFMLAPAGAPRPDGDTFRLTFVVPRTMALFRISLRDMGRRSKSLILRDTNGVALYQCRPFRGSDVTFEEPFVLKAGTAEVQIIPHWKTPPRSLDTILRGMVGDELRA